MEKPNKNFIMFNDFSKDSLDLYQYASFDTEMIFRQETPIISKNFKFNFRNMLGKR